MTSIRHDRLSKVMAFLQSKVKASHDEIYSIGEYTSNRTFQNDLYYLRGVCGADIKYDSHKKLYIMESAGTFQLNLKITKQEIEALTAGLSMATHFLPFLKKSSDSLWDKLRNFIPEEIILHGYEIVRSTMMASPVAKIDAEFFNTLLEAKQEKKAVNIFMQLLKKCLSSGYYRHMIFIFAVMRGTWFHIIINLKILVFTELVEL